MGELIWVALAGFAASLVDGALGMGFGPTSSSILLAAGLTPVTTSAVVNIAKIFSGIAGGAAHWQAGNVDRRLVAQLAGPAVVGAVVGTLALTRIESGAIRPLLAVLLLVVGFRLLARFAARPIAAATTSSSSSDTGWGGWGLRMVALTGGLTNGLIGAWGPVVTPYLLHRRIDPRTVVGSVNTAEIVVAVVSAISLVTSIGTAGIEPPILLAMLSGGVIAAPLSAVVVRLVAARTLGLAMAALLLLTQTRELATTSGTPVLGAVGVTAAAVVAIVMMVGWRQTERRVPDQAGPSVDGTDITPIRG